jgi:hypothetical protein
MGRELLGLEAIATRFWGYVEQGTWNVCWPWQAHRNWCGYGRFSLYGLFGVQRLVLAHRFCYQLSYGEIPKGMQVLHKCDNPPCCNPFHLFLGTQQDNIADMTRKGRHRKHSGMCPNHPDRPITCRGWCKGCYAREYYRKCHNLSNTL